MALTTCFSSSQQLVQAADSSDNFYHLSTALVAFTTAKSCQQPSPAIDSCCHFFPIVLKFEFRCYQYAVIELLGWGFKLEILT